MNSYKQTFEEQAKLLEQLRVAVSAKDEDYDQAKVDKINSELNRKDAELKLIEAQNKKIAGGSASVPDLRVLGSDKILKGGSDGNFKQFISDIIRHEFGLGGIVTRDVLEGSGSGQYIVPESWASSFISYITESSILGRLGVPIRGVLTDTSNYVQISALPTADVIAEGAELTETDATYAPQVLQTYTVRAGTIVSGEALDDAIQSPEIVIEPIMQSIAQHVDSMLVNGTGSSEPTGLNGLTGLFMRLHMGADGAAVEDFSQLGALWRKARESNYEVSAYLLSPRTLNEYRLLEDAEECPKQDPYGFIPMVESNMVLNTDTQGGSDNCSKIWAGDFKKAVFCGFRYGGSHMKILIDRSTLAEFFKVRIYGYCRFGLGWPYGGGAFGMVKGVIPPTGAIT